MSRMVSPCTGRLFGLIRVCEIWAVSRATVYRHRQQAQLLPIARKRPGPIGATAHAELVLKIERLLRTSPFHDEGYRKVWARLRFEALEPVKQAVGRKDTPCRKMPLSASGDEAGQSRMILCFVCCARERGDC